MQLEEEALAILNTYKPMEKAIVGKVIGDLVAKIPARFVSSDWAIRVPYSKDASGGGTTSVDEFRVPDIVVLPGNVEEVAHVCRVSQKHGVPITMVSTGVNACMMAIPVFGGIMVDFKRMNRILEIDTDGLTVTVEPFVNYARVQAELEPLGLRINVPGSPSSVSVLSNTLFLGLKFYSMRYGNGAMEVAGVEYVLPTGKIIRTGSLATNPIERVPDDELGTRAEPARGDGRVCVGTWGPDMSGFVQQAAGGNGIVTKMCVKVYKRQERTKILLFGYKKMESALKLLSEVAAQDIGYGGLVGTPQDNAQANQHSHKDNDLLEAAMKSPAKMMAMGLKVMAKSLPLMSKKPFREIFSGFNALQVAKVIVLVVLSGTNRKVNDEQARMKAIMNDKSVVAEKAKDGSLYQKHFLWPFESDAKPEYIYQLMKITGLKDFRFDWLLRAGKMFDYNEIPARVMRKTAGFYFKSARMVFSKVEPTMHLLSAKMEAAYPDPSTRPEFAFMTNPGAGTHFICMEIFVPFNPKNQDAKTKTFKILREFVLDAMKGGTYFINHLKAERDIIEKAMMPKVSAVTRELREAFHADVLSPH